MYHTYVSHISKEVALMFKYQSNRSITAEWKEYYGARTDGGDEQMVSDCGM